ncbi:MAG: hypothetical protein HYX39_05930 [Bacteroidetes bacterium]|nr:hypothetical protein [Bacteroidota bacterium]
MAWQECCVVNNKNFKNKNMKIAMKYLLIFCLFFGLKSIAQQPGDSRVMASKNSIKGRSELKKENNVKNRSRKNAKNQERAAFKKSPLNKNFNLGKKSKKHMKKSKEKKPKNDEPKS